MNMGLRSSPVVRASTWRRSRRIGIILATACIASMCGEKTSPDYGKGRTSGALQGNAVPGGPRTPEEALLMLTRVQAGIQQTQRELEALREINLRLCQRLNDLRTDCIATIRLLDDDTERTLGCGAMDASGRAIPHNITVSVAGGKRVKMVANGAFETKPFTGGEVVQWVPKGAASARPPRYMDIGSLQLSSADGTALGPAAGLSFEYKVNNVLLYASTDLAPSEAGDSSLYRITGERVGALARSDHCRVTREELDKIREEVRAAKGLATATSAPDPSQAIVPAAVSAPAAGAVAPAAAPTPTTIR